MYTIDINCDLGEGFGSYSIGDDFAILDYITTANVACGWHAGDPMIMDRVVRAAKEKNVAVGAHPGYPDLMGFGRRFMQLKSDEIKNYVKYQIGALMAFTRTYDVPLVHVDPHGALGNLCQNDVSVARAVCEAVRDIDKTIVIQYCVGAVILDIAQDMGLQTRTEVIADRAYMDDLSLVPRRIEGAVIHDEKIVLERCIRMIKDGVVTTITGKDVAVKADSLCVHGDSPEALLFLKNMHDVFEQEAIQLRCMYR